MSERPNIALMTESQKDTLIMALWQELEQLDSGVFLKSAVFRPKSWVLKNRHPSK